MFKRILLVVLLVGFIGALVWGGVVRTTAKSDQVLGVSAEGRGAVGEGHGIGRGEGGEHGASHLDKAVAAGGHEGEDCATDCSEDDCAGHDKVGSASVEDGSGQGRGSSDGQGLGKGEGDGQGIRQGEGDGEGSGEYLYPNSSEAPEDWDTVSGTVVVAPGEDIDLVIETADGELAIGTGPNWMASQGYLLEVGEVVEVTGYVEDGEFKAGTITRMSDGASITLRDENGRPAWAGQGRGKNQ